VLAAHHLRATVVTHFWDPSISRWTNSADSEPDDTDLTLALDKRRYGPAREVATDTRIAEATRAGYLGGPRQPAVAPRRHRVPQATEARGHPPLRHWRHLLVGARNQDEAHALAAAIHARPRRARSSPCSAPLHRPRHDPFCQAADLHTDAPALASRRWPPGRTAGSFLSATSARQMS